MLRATWRELETGPRRTLPGHEGGNPGHRQGTAYGSPRQLSTLPFYWGRTQRGAVVPKVKTAGKRLRKKLKRVNAWVRAMRSRCRLSELWVTFCAKLRGHIQYYAVSYNLKAVNTFVLQATRILFKWLNRRSQRKSFSWVRFALFIKAHPLPTVRTVHPLFRLHSAT